MSFTYKWPRPALTVDIALVVKRSAEEATRVLLIRRKHPPFKDHWALPGGFVEENEPLKDAALRELQEETSVAPHHVHLLQIGTYGDPHRDPRGWTVSVLYGSMVQSAEIGIQAADDAADAAWFNVRNLPPLAFDHKILVRDTFNHMISLLGDVFGTDITCEDLRAGVQSEGLK